MSCGCTSDIAPQVRRALIVGDHGADLLSTLETASLLRRSGFQVHIATVNSAAQHLRSISRAIIVSKPQDLPHAAAAQINTRNYDLVVVLEDLTLKIILDSDLTDTEKLTLLPVSRKEDFQHIASKIGLSKVFLQNGILAPDFDIAWDQTEFLDCAEKLGYPILGKVDFSSAGNGTLLIFNHEEARLTAAEIIHWPILMEKFVEGEELDLSAFYQGGKLVCFSYSEVNGRVGSNFSPSAVRTFTQLSCVDANVFEELRAVGNAIGANGFVNISCILSKEDGRRYFFEADLRPNVWVNAGRLLGDDWALHIANYFSAWDRVDYQQPQHEGFPERVVLPHFARINLWELVTNRYGAWRTLPDDRLVLVFLTLAELMFKKFACNNLKPLVSSELWLRLKSVYYLTMQKLMG